MVLKYLARSCKYGRKLLGNLNPLYETQIEQLMSETQDCLILGPTFEPACSSLNNYLAMRQYCVGYQLSLADISIWSSLQSSPGWGKIHRAQKYPHLSRWYEFIGQEEAFQLAVESIAREKKQAAQSKSGGKEKGPMEQKQKTTEQVKDRSMGGGDVGSFNINLQNAQEGKVVTRFPPEPSGYLHIGHAKAALLNQYFAQHYKGKLIVRFDDTNPSKEKDEFEKNILDDLKLMGINYDRLTYTSDYFDKLLKLGKLLIEKGHIYADDTPVDQMRQERMDGIESKNRNKSIEDTLKVWEQMIKGSDLGIKFCMRLKMDMQNLNKALRDPVAYRCNPTPHWRKGNQYKVYPTYDMACPFVDSYEGVTHALRTSEYKDREEQYYRVLKMIQECWPEKLDRVELWDYSRLSFVHTVLSKRKLSWFVETGRVDGWNDPRFPTVQGIIRRGLTIEALKEFILLQGASKNITLQEWDKIWAINKKLIDPICPRHTAILSDQFVEVQVDGAPQQAESTEVLKNKKHPEGGHKITKLFQNIILDQADAQHIAQNEEVTLMDWGNCIITEVTKDEKTGLIKHMKGKLHLEGSVKTTKLKLTWLPNLQNELIKLRLLDFDYLINKKKVEDTDDFTKLVNDQTIFETSAIGDPNMKSLKSGDIIQLERKGYYRVDEQYSDKTHHMVLFNIPDGSSKQKKK